MAELVAEQIVQAVIAELAGADPNRPTTAADKVFRGVTDPLEAHEFTTVGAIRYAIGVFQGADQPLGENSRNAVNMDSLLEVRTQAAVRSKVLAQVEPNLNLLRKEIHAVLMQPTALSALRLAGHVIDVIPGGAEEPEVITLENEVVGTLEVTWGIHYRHGTADAST